MGALQNADRLNEESAPRVDFVLGDFRESPSWGSAFPGAHPGTLSPSSARVLRHQWVSGMWLQVEVEAALTRRRASPAAWSEWRQLASTLHWLELSEASLPALCAFNRPLRLRAADAGNLFVLDRAITVVPELQFVTFDNEMQAAAYTLGLPCFV
jgi:hypothetical protein